ncbi:MAG: DUF3014 domain-containing protein [Pseudomonadaceae bacterium]|nr:DUF3014 domain-containing protein [Pseudomonadaceae bacterium]
MKHWGVVAGLVAAALIIVVLEYGVPWWQSRGDTEKADAPVQANDALAEPLSAESNAPTAYTPRPIPPTLPPLDQSDVAVIEELADWPVDPGWLEQGDLLRRLAALIDNAARGEVPRSQLAFLLPEQGFSVANANGQLRMSARSGARFDAYLDLLEAFPSEQAARLLTLYAPLLDAALRELGRPDADSIALVRRSVDNVLAVSIPQEGLALVRAERGYAFADESIEAATEFDKQLLRLGPDNLGRLQRYATDLLRALDALDSDNAP